VKKPARTLIGALMYANGQGVPRDNAQSGQGIEAGLEHVQYN